VRSILVGVVVVSAIFVAAMGKPCDVQVLSNTGDAVSVKAVLLEALEGARSSLEIMGSRFTDDLIGDAVIRAYRRGVSVRVLLTSDSERETGSEIEKLTFAGIEVRFVDAASPLDHQVLIVDGRIALSASYEVLASADRTTFGTLTRIECISAAEAPLPQAYLGEFERRWANSTSEASADTFLLPEIFSLTIALVDRLGQCVYLLNASDRTIDLTGWTLSDLEGQYTFPEESEILPNDAYRICSDVFNPAGDIAGLYLEPEHDEIFLLTPTGDIVDEVAW